MAPAPKAAIDFTFFPFINPGVREDRPIPVPQIVTDVNLPISADGVVHVEFTVLNWTETVARNLSVLLTICESCKFAREPEGFTFLSGNNHQTQRTIAIPVLQAFSGYQQMTVDVIPPPAAPFFKIGIVDRCDTCVPEMTPRKGTVHIMRDFIKK
jgi:hypothetical protein